MGRLRDFRFYPLRGSISRTAFFVGKARGFISVGILAACCTCGFFALDAAKNPDYRAAQTFGLNAVCRVKNRLKVDFLGFYA
jgi:hypothetical protein